MPTTNTRTSRNKPSSSRGRSTGGRTRTTSKKKTKKKTKTRGLRTASGKHRTGGNMYGRYVGGVWVANKRTGTTG